LPGQVIVIGATNRPDAVDPALRRPGRFDREFYFPLPSLAARQRILRILTKGWEGWDGDKGEPMIQVLAEATKGYGGADLRVGLDFTPIFRYILIFHRRLLLLKRPSMPSNAHIHRFTNL
jgi:SpoVK/Ycf46/Vps4 family AAA+-type ATPase